MKRIFSILTLLLLLFSLPLPTVATEESTAKYEFLPTKVGTNIVSNTEESPLWQKSALFLGDSICYNKAEQLVDPSTAGWAGRIGTDYDMEWQNLGFSGATVSMVKENCTPNQLLSVVNSAKPDIILLQGGINDAYSGVKLGTVEEGFSLNSFDTTSYAGSMQQLFAICRRYFPDAQVFYLIHHTTPNSLSSSDLSKKNPPKADPANYVTMTKTLCEKWEIPYLNLYEDVRFNTEIFDTANNTTGCMWPDLLHMSTRGYEVLTPYLIAWMEEYLLAKEAEEFLSAVSAAEEAFAAETAPTPEERFALLHEALSAYQKLGSAARHEYRQRMFDLLCLVDEYNEIADAINQEAAGAYALTDAPQTAAADLLLGLWFGLKETTTL